MTYCWLVPCEICTLSSQLVLVVEISPSVLKVGAENAPPLTGAVVINELMYHPVDGGDEFGDGCLVDIVDPGFETRRGEVGGDGLALVAEADETNSDSHGVSSFIVFWT